MTTFEKLNIDIQKESENSDSPEKIVRPLEIKEEQLNELYSFVEPFFQTESDPTQIPASSETYRRLLSIDSHCIAIRADKNDKIVSYAAVLPTTNELMTKFLKHEINEREMFNATTSSLVPESLYLMAIAVAKEYRGKGDVFGMMKEIIDHFKKLNQKINVFVWEFSEEGERFVSILEKRYGLSIDRY